MYPAVHDYETYASEHGPGPVLASGIPNTSSTRPYAPPYVSPGMSARVVAGKWSTDCAESGILYGLLGLTGFACLYSCSYRSKLRAQYDLEEAPCVDCLVHFFCGTCALCQEYRELKSRGFDMGIGWEANLDRQRRGITVAPIVAPGMRR
ncbi:hypothetical protein SO802_028605 [Lithocarpus litseifolius]|uniref:Uncharacterized protein n=1 Tax=Lithocarpus litseifolius TaxID=425828 RepID=A0AAW2BQR1_9ROSI